jgi:hypothetical protein
MANKADYKKLLELEIHQLRKVLIQRKELKTQLEKASNEVTRLREGVIGLAALAGVDVKAKHPDMFKADVRADIGLTEAIRKALDDLQYEFASPTQIRDHLSLEMEFPIHMHKNPLASIQSVLKRLVDSGQVVIAEDKETKRTVYALADGFAAINAKREEEDEGVNE